MILRIARKEFVDLSRDGRFRWTIAIVTILLVVATGVGWRDSREVRREREQAQAAAQRQFDGQGEKNPHAAAHYGLHVFKPKPTLAFLDPGVDPFTGVSVFLEAHRRNDARDRPARDATLLLRFGDLTAATILQQLVPLLIIVLAFPAIVGEREQGTLRQILSLGVRPFDLIAGKALALVAALGLALTPAILLALVLMRLGREESGPTGASAAWLGLGYLLYLGIFLVASLLVSARAETSRGALLALLAFWIGNTMVAPRLATDLARRRVATPSSAEFADAIQREVKGGVSGHDPEDHRLDRLKRDLLAKYQVETVEELPINFQGVALQAGEDFSNAVYDRHHDALWARFARQDRIRRWLGLVFPTLAIRDLSMGLAGTDNRQARAFADAAEAHRRTLVRALNADLAEHGADLGFQYQAGADLWESLPRFRYEPPSLASTLRAGGVAWLTLIGWLVVLAWLTGRASRTLRVL